MKFGAEPKKLAILGGLVLLGGYLFYSNVLSDSTPGPAPAPQANRPAQSPRAEVVAPQVLNSVPQPATRRVGSRGRVADDWHPTMKRRQDDKTDPMTIDPTLRLDLLAKVQTVDAGTGARSIFAFSAPPPPPLPKGPEPKIVPKTVAGGSGEPPAAHFPSGPPKPPPPPPINLKYFGYSAQRGAAQKTAFFLDGDDILVAAEGETVKRRYRVVRVGVNSVVMEDTESKSQQTLPLAPEATA